MLSLFDSKNRDIRAIVDNLADERTGLTESAISSVNEVNSTKDTIQESMIGHYMKAFGITDEDTFMGKILKEDAESVGQMFINSLVENGAASVDPSTGAITTINEATATPFLHTLTASIAINQRIPYEATLHRMYDTRTLDKPTVEIEDVIPMVVAPNQEPEDLIDAFQPGKEDADLFINKTEIVLTDLLETGLTPGKDCKNKDLVTGLDPLARVDRTMRLDHITLTDDSSLAGTTLRLQKGSTPYFTARDGVLNVTYEAVNATTGEVEGEINISAAMDFERGILKYLTADSDEVDKVFFYATVEHSEHTHPIKMTYRNRFEQYTVPTRPHIEVSMPNEAKTDISNMINYFADRDIVTAMTEQISVISSRMEDQRLYLGLKGGHMFEALFNFEPPTNFVHGNLEWLKREFIPFLDQVATRVKFDYNLDDCHFRVGVSPYILKILDTEHVIDKSLTEESRGSGLINYSIGVKTSTNVFYFISSPMMNTSTGIITMMPNQFKNSPVKTYHYFKYASFLTDTIRRSDNARMPAIVYSERNLPIVFEPVSSTMEISNMPITIQDGTRWFIRKAQ